MRRTIAATLGALALAGSVVLAAGGPANADKFKDCGTTVAVVGPGNSGMTQTTTETQIAQCDSASDTGETFETGPVTNRGGGTPPGQQ